MKKEKERKNHERRFHFTVGELIEILKGFPPNLPMITSGYEGGYENFYPPRVVKVNHEPKNPYWDGEFQIAEKLDTEAFDVVVLERTVRHD